MKRVRCLVLCVAVTLAVAACGRYGPPSRTAPDAPKAAPEEALPLPLDDGAQPPADPTYDPNYDPDSGILDPNLEPEREP